MLDEIVVLKHDNDAQISSPFEKKFHQPRQGWTDQQDDVAQRLSAVKTNISLIVPSSSDAEKPLASSESAAAMLSSSSSGVHSPASELQQSKNSDSASVISKSSKRTNVSEEMTSLIRQRVRQQARSLVDKKRGSVQLAKRLLRSQTLQNAETPFNSDDFEATDQQLNTILQLGTKYITKEISAEAPDYIQHRFFQAGALSEESKVSGAIVVFTKPKMAVKQQAEFVNLLTIHKPISPNNVEDPVSRLDPQTFRMRAVRNLRLILSRHGDRFASETHGILGLESTMTKKIERLTREEDEDFGLVEYRNPENWSDWVDHGGSRPNKYFQFNIDLNHLEFEHHWLFGQDDVVARRLRNFYSLYVSHCEKLSSLLKQYAELKQRFEIEVVGEEEQTRINNTLVQIREQISTLKEEMPRIAALMETIYEELQQIEQNANRKSTNYRLDKFPGTTIEDDTGQEFTFATYLLKHVHQKDDQPVTSEAKCKPASGMTRVLSQRRIVQEQLQSLDQERRAAIRKCRIRIQIYFNNIRVCKTDEVPLKWDFTADFSQVYNLKVYEQPETVLLVVSEKFDRGAWRDLAKIYLPFVLGNNLEIHPLERMQFASELVIAPFKNSIGCGEATCSSNLSGTLFCNAVWVEGDSEFVQKSRQTDSLAHQSTFSLIPPETLLASKEDFQNDARIEALYRRYKNRHYSKEKTRRIGMNASVGD